MFVREITPEERPMFFSLAEKNRKIFLRPEWLSIYPYAIDLYGIFNKKTNDLLGGFCFYKSSKLGIPFARNCPFTPDISLFYSNRTVNHSNFLSYRKKIGTAMGRFLLSQRSSMASITLPPEETDVQPFIWQNLSVRVRYTYRIDLRLDEQLIYSNFSTERRNDISKALKDGLTAQEASDHGEVRSLIRKTLEENKLQYESSVFANIFDTFANRENSLAFLVKKDGISLACCFIVYDTNIAYYLLGGYNRKNRHHGAGALCLWEAIKTLKGAGVQVFDFEGSMIPQIESFFRGFGGSLVPFYQIRKYPFINQQIL